MVQKVQKVTSILVCGITDVDVSIQFTSALIQMQTELVRTSGVAVEFEFFTNVNEALTFFHKQGRFDACVVMDGRMAVDPAFMLRHDATKPLVVASYPLKSIDWDRVRTTIAHTTETPSHVGMKYNYDPAKAIPEPGCAYVQLEANSKVQFKIFKITKEAVDSIIETHGDTVLAEDGSLLFYSHAIVDGVMMSPDERFVNLWGRPLYADITSKTQNMGPFDFTGAVGNRKQLR